MNTAVSESLVAPLRPDLLLARNQAKAIVSHLLEADDNGGSFHLVGIFGPWGSGKTHLLKLIGNDLAQRNRLVVAFSAWEHEFESEITKSLVARLADPESYPWQNNSTVLTDRLKTLRTHGAFRQLWDSLPNASIGVAGISANVSVQSIVKAISSLLKRSSFEDHPSTYKTRSNFKKTLDSLRAETFKHTYILIDDLDRCEPNNAISFLASIKNLLQVEGCTFLMGLDDRAIKAALDSIYGNYQIDAEGNVSPENYGERYLQKLFDISYQIAKPQTTIELMLSSVSQFCSASDYLANRLGIEVSEGVICGFKSVADSTPLRNPRAALRIFRVYDLTVTILFGSMSPAEKQLKQHLAVWLFMVALQAEGFKVLGMNSYGADDDKDESAAGLGQWASGHATSSDTPREPRIKKLTRAEYNLMNHLVREKQMITEKNQSDTPE